MGFTRRPIARQPTFLKVENNAAHELKIVLGLTEKACAHPIAFQTPRKAWIETIIRAASCFNRVRVLTVASGLRLFMASAKNGMGPWFPFLFSPGDFRPGAVDQEFDVLPVEDFRSEAGGHASFDSEPLIGEISHRSI